MKKQHEKLRTKNVHVNIFPKYYKEVIETIKHPLNKKLNKGTSNYVDGAKGIYFPGVYENRITTSTYPLPFSCAIFLVVELFDIMGSVVSHIKDEEKVFHLNQIIYDYFDSDFRKRLQKYIKYSILLKIEKGKLIDVIVTNDQIRFKLQWMRGNFVFDKITLGAGPGILYDFIVYNWFLKQEEIDKIVLFLNKMHDV